MPPDYALLDVLRRHGVPFVVVGGHAVNYHGYVRATEDVDVVWQRSPESEQALARALAEVDAQYLTAQVDPATGIERTAAAGPAFIASHHLMMLWVPNHTFLDLFDYVPGQPDADVEELFRTSEELDGLRYASLSWLRRMKRAGGRPKDLLDLENLPPANDTST